MPRKPVGRADGLDFSYALFMHFFMQCCTF